MSCTSTQGTTSGDAFDEQVRSLLPRVAPIVRSEVARAKAAGISPSDAQDLEQEAWLGALEGWRSHDPSREVPLGAHIRLTVRNALMRARRRADLLSETARRDLRALCMAEAVLRDTGMQVASEAVASWAGLSLKRAQQVTQWNVAAASVGQVDDVAETLPAQDTFPEPEQWALSSEWRLAVRGALQRLPEREGEAVKRRVLREEPIADVAAHLGVSPGRVSQLVSQGLTRLREDLADWRPGDPGV